MRRLLLLYLSCILLAFGVPQSRAFIFQQADRPEVQAFVEASVGRGQLATRAIIAQVRSQTVTFVGGKPVIGGTAVDTSDNWSLNHGCSLSAEEVEAVLKAYNSPAATEGGFGQMTVDECKRTGIDNAYVMAMFIHESTAGTAGAAVETHSTGNIICTDGNCAGRFQVYPDWKAGGRAHFTLLKCYRDGGGSGCDGLWSGKKHETIVDALYTWAPPSDNNNQNQDCNADPGSYPCAVKRDVSNWRAAHTTVATTTDSELRRKVIELALSRKGDPYVSGARGAGASDCSGFTQYVYKTATGIDIGPTTYVQHPNLQPVEEKDLRPGDLWFGHFDAPRPNDEHTGIVADVNGDGKWDLIHNGADVSAVHVTLDFLHSSYLGEHTMGFRTVLGDK